MQKEDVRLRQVIIHIMDSTMGMPVLSDQVIDFGSDFGDFLRAHIFRLLESDDMKKCSFDEGSQVQAELEAYSEENFIPVSQKLGELLYGVMIKISTFRRRIFWWWNMRSNSSVFWRC